MKSKISAGLVILISDRILLIHPTNSKWYGTYSFPKGRQKQGETLLETALRETKEEVGISVPIESTETQVEHTILYKDIQYVYFICTLNEVPCLTLQKSECDWAGLLDKQQAEKRIFAPFKPILNLLR